MRNFNKKPTIKSSLIYFQLGLVLALTITLIFIEKSSKKNYFEEDVVSTEVFKIEDAFEEVVKLKKAKPNKPKSKKITKQLPVEILEPKDLEIDDFFDTRDIKNIGDLNLKDIEDEEIENIVNEDKKYSVDMLSEVPIFPGCNRYKTRSEKIKCFSDQVRERVSRKFNSGLGADLGLQGRQRIYVNFTINKQGEITQVKASSKYKLLAEEAERVTKLLPNMIPGKQNGKAVEVNYSLPIILEIQ